MSGTAAKRLGLMIALLLPAGAHAVDTLSIGQNGRWPGAARSWWACMESSQYMTVGSDSIWMWDVRARSNLSRGVEERSGGAWYVGVGPMGPMQMDVPNGQVLYDGDSNTAFDPDMTDALERTTPIVLDLGGTFQVNRLRLFPRLDRINRHRYLQELTVSTSPGPASAFFDLVTYNEANPNIEPVLDDTFASRSVRLVQVAPAVNREWELAEIEVYGDGTVPVGAYQSKVFSAGGRSYPVWGKVRYEGGDITQLPVIVRTRTGPNSDPLLYYLTDGEELYEVPRATYEAALEDERGPVEPNPEWSPWTTLDEGRVTSPPLRTHIQFRVEFSQPGTVLRTIVFEVAYPPLARDLLAEIGPSVATGGEVTDFILSMVAYLRIAGVNTSQVGFRQIQVLTSAEIGAVDAVLVDDKPIVFTSTVQPGEGFTVNLWQRVLQDGSFLQIKFHGAVFRDQTRFEVRALDRRADEDGGVQTVYQLAREEDVAVESPGGSLTVRLTKEEDEELPLITRLLAPRVFTPNGDGVNDTWQLAYTLLKLVDAVPVELSVYDLSGREVYRAPAVALSAGNHQVVWDGRDAWGRLLQPGTYVYELRVPTDEEIAVRRGVVGVVF